MKGNGEKNFFNYPGDNVVLKKKKADVNAAETIGIPGN